MKKPMSYVELVNKPSLIDGLKTVAYLQGFASVQVVMHLVMALLLSSCISLLSFVPLFEYQYFDMFMVVSLVLSSLNLIKWNIRYYFQDTAWGNIYLSTLITWSLVGFSVFLILNI